MKARYPGHCALCLKDIQIGTLIRKLNNDWVHSSCVTPVTVTRVPRTRKPYRAR